MNKKGAAALCKAVLWGICILFFPILSGVLSALLALGTIETLFLQGIFMLLSLVLPLIFVMTKKWRWSEIGFAKLDINGCKKAMYFLPLLAVLIPVAVKGFYARSAAFVLGNLFLYLSVGIAEEVYFRGIVPKYLNSAFSFKGVIFLSAAIFGIDHIASAFTAGNGSEVLLSVLNAFIFGWLAIEMVLICKNITPCIPLHFMFDFETKIVVMDGNELMTAECIRGAVMVLAAVWLGIILVKLKETR